MAKILVTSQLFPQSDPALLAILKDAGHEVVFNLYHPKRTNDEMIKLLDGVAGGIVSVDPFNGTVLDAAKSLKVVARTGVGYDEIDLVAATRNGIAVLTTPGVNSNSVADTAIALLMAIARGIVAGDRSVRAGGWRDAASMQRPEVWGKTIGIVGFGAIGKGVARRAAGFNLRVLAYDIVYDHEFAKQHGASYVSLEQLLAESDFVSLHMPLTTETRAMIGEAALKRMKPTAYLINTARGPVVDEEALYRALTEGWIAGAGLDVFMNEPPVGSPLLGLPNVVLTPHIAGVSREANKQVVYLCARNVVSILKGEPPTPNSVRNPEALDK